MGEFLLGHPGLAIALVIALGAAAQWAAWRLHLPAILPLLLIGFAVGPLLGWLDPSQLVGDDLLFPAVGLAVALILFEGGLTLSIPEIKETRRVLFAMITVGVAITWLGGAAAAYLLTDLTLQLSFLFGALIIVTGPTVIGPLLRIVRPDLRVANLLKWEGILVDVVGAMMAVLVFQFIVFDNRAQALGQTLLLLLEFVAVGSVMGVVAGFALATVLRRRWVPDYLVNLVALSFVFAAFAASDVLVPEAGLLATVLMGAIVANRGVPGIEDLLSFKEDLTILFISLLFIVLAANIELATLLEVMTWQTLLLLAVVMVVIRPLNVFVSSIGSVLGVREKLYLSWIAPRGIVAAAVSSLFATKLVAEGFPGASLLIPLVFFIIVGTVLANSVTAKPLAILLRVAEPNPDGFLIVGAHPAARHIGMFLQQQGCRVLMADTNRSNLASARDDGLETYYGSPLSDHAASELPLAGIGRLLALTPNDEANALITSRYAREFGSRNVFQLAPSSTSDDRTGVATTQRGRTLFLEGVTYAELDRKVAAGAEIRRVRVTEPSEEREAAATDAGEDAWPMFVVQDDGLRVLAEDSPAPEQGATIACLVEATDDERIPATTGSSG